MTVIYLAILSLLAVLVAWAQLGLVGTIGVAVALVLAWGLGLHVASVMEEERRAWTDEEERRVDEEAAREWAREELLRNDSPAGGGREHASDNA